MTKRAISMAQGEMRVLVVKRVLVAKRVLVVKLVTAARLVQAVKGDQVVTRFLRIASVQIQEMNVFMTSDKAGRTVELPNCSATQ